MLLSIFRHELKHWLRQPSTYLYCGIFLLFAILSMAGSAGAWDEPSSATGPVEWMNSPAGIFEQLRFFNKFLLFLLPVIFGGAIYRDYQTDMHKLLYTYPLRKGSYLVAKFAAAFLVMLLIAISLGIGLFLGTLIPGVQVEKLGPFYWMAYLQSYFFYLIPNIFTIGLFIFTLVTWTRNSYSGFILVLILLLIKGILGNALAGIDTRFWLALLEPFGESAIYAGIYQWTIPERNEQLLPVLTGLLWNRLFWLGLATLFSIRVYQKFSFSQLAPGPTAKSPGLPIVPEPPPGQVLRFEVPQASFDFTFWAQLKACWRLSNWEFRSIVNNWSFMIMVSVGLLFVVFAILQMNPPYETRVLPVTWFVLVFPSLFFSLVINALTFLYAGKLIHQARAERMNQLMDVTPVPNWSLLLSKLLALIKMQIVLLSLLMVGGIMVQIYQGYYHFDIMHYLVDLYGIHLIGFVIWALAAIFIQTLFTNPYLGFFLLLLGFIGISGLQQLGIEQAVFRFNQNPDDNFLFTYSEMNGYGAGLGPYLMYKFYWLLGGLCLLAAALLLWIRGFPQGFGERLQLIRSRFQTKNALFTTVCFLIFLGMGFRIYHEESSTRKHLSNGQEKALSEKIKDQYRPYEHLPQPRIVSVNVQLDLSPSNRSFQATGKYFLLNKTSKPIDTLVISTDEEVLSHYQLDREFRIMRQDSLAHLDILRLIDPLAPGDSLGLTFQVQNKAPTFLHPNRLVAHDGTYLTNAIFPNIGYWPDGDLPSPQDSMAQKIHYRGRGADYIDFETTISTEVEQIAVAPGTLLKEWISDGRRYFQYKTEHKITNDYCYNSGRYQVKRAEWNGVQLEIYYHPGHEYNLERMMSGMRASLAFNTKNFSPYPHRQLRIVEFARTLGDFGQSFASTMPISETTFIMDIAEGALDYPFVGVVHETAHQWWGHQVVPANAQGTRMITEGMAEYVSLKVLEEQFGTSQQRKFLQKARDTYLRFRSQNQEEQPLIYVKGLSPLAYQKAALALYALSDYLGEDTLYDAIKTFVEKVRFQEAPYPTALGFLAEIQGVTPDALQYLVTDLFESITLYDNRIAAVDVIPLPEGKYEVTIDLLASKYRDDGQRKRQYGNTPITTILEKNGSGTELKSLPLADYIEVGIFGQKSADGQEEVLYLQKHLFRQIENRLTIVVDQRPVQVAIDPYLKLMDTDIADNHLEL